MLSTGHLVLAVAVLLLAALVLWSAWSLNRETRMILDLCAKRPNHWWTRVELSRAAGWKHKLFASSTLDTLVDRGFLETKDVHAARSDFVTRYKITAKGRRV